MTPREVGFRLRRKMQGDIERAGIGLAHPSEPKGVSGRPWVLQLPRGFDTRLYTRAADRILAGRFDVFALEDAQLGFPPRWNVDPKTGIEAPLEFGLDLDYRDAARVGDIKYLWEINRHLELVTLAQAWHLTADEGYAQGAKILVDSWLEACPYPKGANWCASLEHAIRLVNWAFAWQLLGADASPLFEGREGRAFRRRWLAGIYQHCHFIAATLLAPFLGQQSPARRGDRTLHRVPQLAVLARERALARPGPRGDQPRGAAADIRGRRQPRAGDLVPPLRGRHAAHRRALRPYERLRLRRAVLAGARIHARLPGEHHGCGGRRARHRRCGPGCVGSAGADERWALDGRAVLAGRLPLAARERRGALRPAGISPQGGGARRQDTLASRR